MPVESRPKQVVYKRCEVVGVDAPADPLAALLKEALRTNRLAGDRLQPLDGDGGHCICNSTRNVSTMVAGSVLQFTPGNQQLLVRMDLAAPEFALSQIAPPDQLSEFLQSQLFFGVLDDHVAVAQSRSLRSGDLERYLTWLLRDRAGLLPSSARVILQDRVSLPSGRSPRRLEDVRGVTLSTYATPASIAGEWQVPESRQRTRPGPLELLHRVVGDLLPNDVRRLVEGYAAAEGLRVEELKVTLEITRAGRRSPDGPPRSVVDDLAEVLRNTDDVDFELDVPGVGKITRTDLRLQTRISAEHQGGALLFERFASKLFEWLAGLMNRGEIAPPRQSRRG